MGFLCQSSSPSQSTVIQELPDYIKQPAIDNLKKAAEIADSEYQAYGGPRIADFTQDQLDAMQRVRDMQGGQDANLDAAMSGLRSLEKFSPEQIQARQFDSQTASDYMNPYTENVLDRARQRIFDADDIARQKRDARAIGAGAFGDNSRRFVQEAEAQSNLQDRLADMEAKQLAAAYESGAKIFGQDANRALQADARNQAAGLSANQQNNLATIQGAQGIGRLAQLQQGLDLQGTQALTGIGAAQQGLNQAGLDLAYGDFLAQQNFPKQQVAFMSDILQGTPSGQTTTTFGPPGPSPFQSLAGLGIAGLGLYGSGGGFSPGGFAMDNLFNRGF